MKRKQICVVMIFTDMQGCQLEKYLPTDKALTLAKVTRNKHKQQRVDRYFQKKSLNNYQLSENKLQKIDLICLILDCSGKT